MTRDIPKPAAVLFDIGGTLLPETACASKAGFNALVPDDNATQLAVGLCESIESVH